MNYFVTAIGTDSGKTLVSAILVEALKADYWKPVQCGLPRDLETVQSWVSNKASIFHDEKYLLNVPASPHAAAKKDQVSIYLNNFSVPKTSKDLIIEGAGGTLVPLNDHEMVIDMVREFNAKVILVCDLYLGSINHSLLTAELLKNRGYKVKGIIFNGKGRRQMEEESMDIILKYSGFPCLMTINEEKEITKEIIRSYAEKLRKEWDKW